MAPCRAPCYRWCQRGWIEFVYYKRCSLKLPRHKGEKSKVQSIMDYITCSNHLTCQNHEDSPCEKTVPESTPADLTELLRWHYSDMTQLFGNTIKGALFRTCFGWFMTIYQRVWDEPGVANANWKSIDIVSHNAWPWPDFVKGLQLVKSIGYPFLGNAFSPLWVNNAHGKRQVMSLVFAWIGQTVSYFCHQVYLHTHLFCDGRHASSLQATKDTGMWLLFLSMNSYSKRLDTLNARGTSPSCAWYIILSFFVLCSMCLFWSPPSKNPILLTFCYLNLSGHFWLWYLWCELFLLCKSWHI